MNEAQRTPWSTLGHDLTPGASINDWRKESGLDYKVLRAGVSFKNAKGHSVEFKGKEVVFRSDTQEPLGLVSGKYQIHQPGEILEFFHELVNLNGYQLKTAGTLGKGRKYWALAYTNKEGEVCANDPLQGYLLLTSSCDGTLGTTGKFTSIAVVCENTLTAALKQVSDVEKVYLSHRSIFDKDKLKDDLANEASKFDSLIGFAKDLSKKQVSSKGLEEWLVNLLVSTGTIHKSVKEPTKSKIYQKILELYEGEGLGSTLSGRSGTLWGGVNAVTEYIDYHAASKSKDNQLANAWYGRGEIVKVAALESALKLT